jgi:hypothetical protein
MLSQGKNIRYHIAIIFAAHWSDFVSQYKKWIRPVVFENVRKMLACRTPVLGCHIYKCQICGHFEIVPHSCKSRFCPTCGKHATDVWSTKVLNKLLDCPYHHLVLTIPWQLRIVILMNRWAGLNLLFQAASMSIQQWSHDIKKMKMGILLVAHTFGANLKWHPHIHLIVTGGGLSLEGIKWISTDPRFLMYHKGLKSRWKYQVITRMKQAHKQGKWRFPKAKGFLKSYPCFAFMLNKLWGLIWFVYIGASLLDPRFSVKYIGRYTKRAVMAEYRIVYYDGKIIRFSYKDYASGGKTSYMTLKVNTFIALLIRHIPDKHFSMVRYAGLFCNRWKSRYLSQARQALKQPFTENNIDIPCWAERQENYTGTSPLTCPFCKEPLIFVGVLFGDWKSLQFIFEVAQKDSTIPTLLLKPG